MSSKWIENVRKVTPYVPGEQPEVTNIIKLNTNENPYPPTPLVKTLLEGIEIDKLRLYPNPESQDLTVTIAEYYGISPKEVFIGNGSDEVLALAFLTFFNSDKEILFADITYSFYPVYCDLYGIKYRRIPLNDKFEVVVSDYKASNGGIIIANPNAPTSKAVGLEAIEEIIASNPQSVVIIDEAYVDFGAQSAICLINKYDNVLVVQTLSKSRALAGIRLGFALGSEKLLSYLYGVKNSFNSYPVDYIAQKVSSVAIKDKTYFEEITNKVVATRTFLTDELRKLNFEVLDSSANFIFVTHPKVKAKKLFEYLKDNKIFVRYFNLPRIDNYLRISIGTDEEIDQLIKYINKAIIESKV